MNILEKHRREKGLTYKEIGEKLGLSQPQAWRLCNDGIPKNLNIPKISSFLGISEAEAFIGMSANDNEEKNGGDAA